MNLIRTLCGTLLAASSLFFIDACAKEHKQSHSSSSSSSSISSGKFSSGVRSHESGLPPWIDKKGDVFVYKFNVFNLDPNLSQKTVKSMVDAQTKDINETYRKDWGVTASFKVYTADQISNPKLFKGDRIPIYIGSFGGATFSGFHCVQVSGVTNQDSFLLGGCNIQDSLGIEVPSNFPDYTPYAAIGTNEQAFVDSIIANDNPYGPHRLLDEISLTFNHEVKEILGDDSLQMATLFDTFAPTVATWHYAEFNEDGEVTNGTIGPDGYVRLPFFLEQFPAGGLFFTLQENADCVGRGRAGILNGYRVDGWYMTNYPSSNFWRGYLKNDKLRWDYKGYVENPLQPYSALLEGVYFLDFATGTTYYGQVENWGPVTVSQRGDPLTNNFPPDYTFVSFLFDFNSAAKNANKTIKPIRAFGPKKSYVKQH